MYSWRGNLKSVRPHFLGQIDIWTGSSSRGQLEKTLKLFISWPFQLCHNFEKGGNFALTCYVDNKWATPKKLDFFKANLDEVHHPQSWRAIWGHFFWRFPRFHGASNMCSNFLPNPSNQVVHNHHLVLRGKKKPTQIGHHMWKIIGS